MIIRTVLVAAIVLLGTAHAEVFPVGSEVRVMDAEREVVHTLEALKTGTRLGEQRSRFVRTDDELRFEVVITYGDGTVSTERGAMSIADGYRALEYQKVDRRNGQPMGELRVDFASGMAEWTVDGVQHQKTFEFSDDTYAGPMLAFVLAAVPQGSAAHASFEMLTFRPDPRVYTIGVDVVDRGTCEVVEGAAKTTKLRLKADLGSVGNVLFERLIPTHYFWYTQGSAPDFFAFEGQLGHDGPDLVMFPVGQSRSTPPHGTVVARQ